jgi:putative transposase
VAWFYGESDEVSGSPKILMDLREGGEVISRKTVAKVMAKFGLRGVCPKRWKTTTIRNGDDAYPADVVQRRWDTGALNQIWVGDISCLRTWEGWLYLATVIDAHSRRVIGWAIDEHLRSDLVEDALRMAITLRGERPEKVSFHTDRGTQTGLNRSSQHLDDGGDSWELGNDRSRFARIGGRSPRRGRRRSRGAKIESDFGRQSVKG